MSKYLIPPLLAIMLISSSCSSTANESTMSSTTATPTTTAAPTTTEEIDTEPPSAPTNLACGGFSGGSGEFTVVFDAPPDPSDIDTIRVYTDQGSGFERVVKTPIDGSPATFGLVIDLQTDDPVSWSIYFYSDSLGAGTFGVALTFGDAAGNESGWYPATFTANWMGDCSVSSYP